MLEYLQKNKDITPLSNFNTKALAEYYFEINDLEEVKKLKEIQDFADKNDLKLLFVWAGTNMLFAFDKFEWIVIKNNLNWWSYDKEKKILKTYSNELISNIAENLEKDYSQNLWHRFIGLPWSVWWAVYWNAWCFGLETENNFLSITVYNMFTWKLEKLSKHDMNFSYRNSVLKEKWSKYFIVDIEFDLSTKIEKYHSEVDNIDFRENKQPKGYTCGSFFKNPSREQSAWFLIEQVWLKWYKVWWAYFSDIHANFLMSDWETSYTDLIKLISLAQRKVRENFWINLVNEVRIITN